MRLKTRSLLLLAPLFAMANTATAQTFPTDDPIIRQMWEVGIKNSQTQELAHILLDRIGPRLAGSPNLALAQEWLLKLYHQWGVTARREQYGTWRGWQQGALHVDMVEPRHQTLEAHILAWSPATDGPVTAEVVAPPPDLGEDNVDSWLESIRGKFVMVSPAELMCRARQELETYARTETVERLDSLRRASRNAWYTALGALGSFRDVEPRIDGAGAAGIISSRWSGGWGVNKIFGTRSQNAVAIDLSCEDYGLLARLIDGGSTPTITIDAATEDLGVVPQFNVIAELRGSELPDEYVLLGAHLDSWHGATGATDNGTGTITMLEAMRILKETYPNPRRTIIVGHWGAEEMGGIGSNAFREDHPEVMEGLHVAFNQDNGTWAFEKIEGQGMMDAGNHIPGWMSAVPRSIASHIELEMPGAQNNRGSDHTSFLCAGLPSFRLQSPYDEYRQYTWHTNRDTYDKIVFDDLKENATLAAMLAYRASEDPEPFERGRAILPISERTGEPGTWSQCREPRRVPR